MVRAPLLVLASAAGSALASPLVDVSALVQRDARLHSSAASAAEACECIGWKDAYTKHGMMCGAGRELELVDLPGLVAANLIPTFKEEFCYHYFRALPNDNYCMNNKFANKPTEWCYVSPDCKEGAVTVASQGDLMVKNCTRERDATLGEMKFEDFATWAYGNKLELGLAVQYAFPTWEGAKLPDVQEFYGLGRAADAKPLSDDLRRSLKELQDSGKTMFFTSRNGHPPFGVAEGQKLYYINFNPKQVGFSKKEDMNLWGCVSGCGQKNKKLW